MSELEIKQLSDIIFMLITSIVVVSSVFYGIYLGFSIAYHSYKKTKSIKKIQMYADNNQFVKVITFDKHGIPVLIEVEINNKRKILKI